MADPGPKTGSDLLQEWCEKAQAILRQVVVQAPEDEDLITSMLTTKSPFKPHWVWDCDCLMFLEARKTGLLISRTHHRGFMLRRLPTKDGRYRWSGPCFLRVETTGVGLSVGRVHSAALLAAMTPKLRCEVVRRRHRTFSGVDSVLACGSKLALRADFVVSPAASYGEIGAAALRGVMFDFSYAVGLLTVDDAANAAAYGKPVATGHILDGELAAPAELAPLFAELAAAATPRPANDSATPPAKSPQVQVSEVELAEAAQRGEMPRK